MKTCRQAASSTCTEQRQDLLTTCIRSQALPTKLINLDSRPRTCMSKLICKEKMDSSLRSQPCNHGSTSIRRKCSGAMSSLKHRKRLSLSTTCIARTLASSATIVHPTSFQFLTKTCSLKWPRRQNKLQSRKVRLLSEGLQLARKYSPSRIKSLVSYTGKTRRRKERRRTCMNQM